jgi:hypothetical protein
LQVLAQFGRQAPIARHHLPQLVQGRALAEQGDQPARGTGGARQRQLLGEDARPPRRRQPLQKEQQAIGQQGTIGGMGLGHQLREPQRRGQRRPVRRAADVWHQSCPSRIGPDPAALQV